MRFSTLLGIGDHVQAVVFILEQLPVAHRADVVAQRGRAGRLDAGEDALLFNRGLILFHGRNLLC